MSVKLAVKKILRGVMTNDVAITYRAPYGIPGDISRGSIATVETQPFNSAAAFPAYGLPGQLATAAGKFSPITATGQVVYGILARPFPTTSPDASDPLGTAVPPTYGAANILRRGYITVNVQLGGSSCALGSGVFVRYQNPSGNQIVGGLEGATSSNNYQITNVVATFMGPVDANGNAEIAFNI